MTVRTLDGNGWSFTDCRIARSQPWRSDLALRLLDLVLRKGAERVSWSDGWRPPDEERRFDVADTGMERDRKDDWERAWELAVDEAKQRWGVEIVENEPLPKGIPRKAWLRLWGDAIRQEKNGGKDEP